MSNSQSRPTWGTPHPGRSDPEPFQTLDPSSRGETGPELPPPAIVADRYEVGGRLGAGAMAVVWEAWDRTLHRPVALKVMRAPQTSAEGARYEVSQFEEEARIAAQLDHPGIIPVHDLGVFDDGRAWFTMKKVEGRTLEERGALVHRAWRLGREEESLSLRRLLEAFLRVCETVAFAHARGVAHRDLKPSNIMLGDFGEVWVVDWGLAGVVRPPRDDLAPISTAPHEASRQTVVGTPAYMAPEQARGDVVSVAADVHALGATLYDVLCERPPRLAASVWELLADVAEAKPFDPPTVHAQGAPIPEDLEAICLRALAAEPGDRFADAGQLAEVLAAWLDGARDRDRALQLVVEADQLLEKAEDAQSRGEQLEAQGQAMLRQVSRTASDVDKAPAWALEEEARELQREARREQVAVVQLLRAALTYVPGLPEAHERLADLFHAQHRALEAARRDDDALAVAAELESHDTLGRYRQYLDGRATLSLWTDPDGADVRLHRLEEHHRRPVPVFDRVLGQTPLVEVPLPRGSYLLTLHAEGRAVVRLPVTLTRGEAWTARPPGADAPHRVILPRQEQLAAGDCYVPGGWFWVGDDRFEHTLPRQRMWCDPFVIGRDPITVGEYVAFLNDLLANGRADEAEAAAPTIGDTDEAFLAREQGGRFTGIRTDRHDGGWDALPKTADVPMVMVTWAQACAYTRWRTERDGLPWRLPMERVRQRAARGSDDRLYPWGEHFEPTWCRNALSEGPTSIATVGAHPVDESPFGVRGLAGNVSEWVADPVPFPEQDASERVLWAGRTGSGSALACGGSCAGGPLTCTTSQRNAVSASFKAARVGFRISRPWGETLPPPDPSDRASHPEEDL